MDAARGTILLVEWDEILRDRLGSWLELGGFEVLVCPGPRGPTYECAAGGGVACPLVSAADAVVLGEVEGDTVGRGLETSDLRAYYTVLGTPVLMVAELPIGRPTDPWTAWDPPGPSPREVLLTALDALLATA